MEIARFILGTVLLVVFGALALQLYKGRWLELIAKPEITKKGTFFPEGTTKAAQHAAWVMVTCFAIVATLMAYEMGKLTGMTLFVQIATVLNNISLLAFCGCLLWTLFAGWKKDNYASRFKTGRLRLFLLLLASCILMTAVSILFA
ncbi:hypothetical protein [Eggerthella sp. YY7918]|uniref:hypothetical protein n=1 Tax=Eggerthella sp. (strain YY7918) TaxID=502558 RepID=UPI0002171812|nr:hypothetical protein [Eggerthella sp. YY7918]BAK44540.1 bacterial lipocalin [Eggerthella sp. YY7918]